MPLPEGGSRIAFEVFESSDNTTGKLPISVDLPFTRVMWISGGSPYWEWRLSDAVFANNSEERITFRLILVVDLPSGSQPKRISPTPNTAITVVRGAPWQGSIDFKIFPNGTNPEENLSPGKLREVAMNEIGGLGRRLSIPFE
jgi:hypothetical protein